ncbi:MAG: hypothetical protein EON87_11590 [Brevundimonas sp.]|nr:MAG: hypothetical protein EON87_11590 [Brevundimonas sp.]
MTRNHTAWTATALAAGLLLTGQGCARAQTPPEGFVWYFLSELNGFYLDVEDPTNRPALIKRVPDGVLSAVEVNGDGQADWLIRWPDSAQFCGTGGCRTTLYISGQNGFVRAFDRQALRFDVGRVDGEVRIEAALHHLYCNEGQVECLRAWAWDPSAGRLQERPSSDGISRMSGGAPVDFGEEPDGTPILPEGTPTALQELRFRSRVWCPAVNEPDGHYLRQGQVYDIPDVNGDGLRDWVFAPEAGCATPPESGQQIWVTTGRGPGAHGEGGAVALAWTSPQDHWIEYDVSERPATALVVRPCDSGQDCPGVPLRWNASEARLVE